MNLLRMGYGQLISIWPEAGAARDSNVHAVKSVFDNSVVIMMFLGLSECEAKRMIVCDEEGKIKERNTCHHTSRTRRQAGCRYKKSTKRL